ncbi:MAG: CapA family protein [candidate division WOR-3 bacterium]
MVDTLFLTIALMGDLVLGNVLKDRIPPDSGFILFKKVKNFIEESDLSFANFEGVFNIDVTDRNKEYRFLFPLSSLRGLKKSGIKGFSIANNHIYDGGEKAARKTYEILKKEGFIVSGLKGTFDTFRIKNLKVGFIAYSVYDYTNNLLREEDLKLLEVLAKKTDILIVSIHAGAEGDSAMHVKDKFEYFYGEKRGNVKKLARYLVDIGSDIVFGHGPHVIRGIEIYKERIIAYSLSNFACFWGLNLFYPRNISFILKVKVNSVGEFIEGEIVPLILNPPGIPEYDEKERALKILEKLIKEDKLENVKIEGTKILKF